jgi:hypothetical protein
VLWLTGSSNEFGTLGNETKDISVVSLSLRTDFGFSLMIASNWASASEDGPESFGSWSLTIFVLAAATQANHPRLNLGTELHRRDVLQSPEDTAYQFHGSAHDQPI